MKNTTVTVLALLFLCSAAAHNDTHGADAFDPYTVAWSTPGKGPKDSMPLGNGDIALNAWVEENGDLLLCLSKTDAWSENARLLKLGQIRLSLSPNPMAAAVAPFMQRLSVKDGQIDIRMGETKIRLWIDANHPAVELDIESPKPLTATVALEPWRVKRRELKGQDIHSAYGLHGDGASPIFVEPDTILSGRPSGELAWYHQNKRSIWADNLKLQRLETLTETEADPLLHNTFGALIQGSNFVTTSSFEIRSRKPQTKQRLSIYPLTKRAKDPATWLAQVETNAKQIAAISRTDRHETHRQWWQKFWQRSYIHVTAEDDAQRKIAQQVTRAYALQRFINACAGRGNFPIKFNGSLFTVGGMRDRNGGPFDPDYRRWGGPYWWQNTRLPYWSMLTSGDTDLMQPLFKMYRDILPLRQAATRQYFKHDGAFFWETQYFWGTSVDGNYGRDRSKRPDGITENNFIRYYWQSGLELSLIMLDTYSHTEDKTFARDTLVPIASSALTFFDQHWKRDANGKIRFEPAMALETYRTAVNPIVEIVAIRKVATLMLALPKDLTTSDQRAEWRKMIADLPPIPTRDHKGEKVLAPAQTYKDKQNSENPELYAIFPYRLYRVGEPGLDLALRTYAIRSHKSTGGWQQSAIQAAYLGLGDEAWKFVAQNARSVASGFRFPTMWGPNADWIPDQDHGTVMMSALQRMLLHYDGDSIRLLPAWPKNLQVEFKLHGPGKTIIEGKAAQGKLIEYKVTPSARKKDILLK